MTIIIRVVIIFLFSAGILLVFFRFQLFLGKANKMSAKIDRCVFRCKVSSNEFTLFYFAFLLVYQNTPTYKICFLENIAELIFGTFLVPTVSVFGTRKRAIRFRYFDNFLKPVIRYRYFGTVFRYLGGKLDM